MPAHSSDVYRTGSTNFTSTETNSSSLFLGNGTERSGYRVVATHQGITGGTNDVSTIHATSSPTGGTYTLTLGAQTTVALAYNAAPATIQAALLNLKNVILQNVWYPSLPSGCISVTGSATGFAAGDCPVTFQNALGNIPITLTIGSGSLTGGSGYTITHTTTGVGPTCAITLQHNNDNSSTWLAWRKFGTLDVPTWPAYRPSLLFGTPMSYLSMTLTFGGTGTYKNLRVYVVADSDGYGG